MDNFQAQAQPTNTAYDLCSSPTQPLYVIARAGAQTI